MSTIINATTTNGVVIQPDNSGSLVLQTNSGTTALTIDTSQRAAFVAGTAALPAITTTGDTNTGIWFPAADTIAFAEGGAESMRIDSSGNVLAGTTNSSDSAGAGCKIINLSSGVSPSVALVGSASTNGTGTGFQMYSTGVGSYRFYVGYGGTIFATATSITGISDQRVKENIVDLDEGLDAVMALKPRKFDWKEGKGKDIKGDRGFIAQEFETVFPDMIEEWKDQAPEGEEPYKAVNANIIPTLVKAIQEQQAIINELKARVETLEAK